MKYIYSQIIYVLGLVYLFFLITYTSNDVVQYVGVLLEVQDQNFIEFLNGTKFREVSWAILFFLMKITSASYAFYILAVSSLTAKYYIFSKYYHHYLLAFISYTLIFVQILDANQIREALAVCLVFIALSIEPKRKYTYFLLAIIGVLFHYSALVILLFYFSRHLFLSIVVVFLSSFYFINILLYYPLFDFTQVWLTKIPNQVNFTNSLNFFQACISIAAIISWKELSSIQKKAVYFNTIGVSVYLCFYEYPIIAHRVRELTQIAIIPLLFFHRFKLTYSSLAWSLSLLFYIFYVSYMVILEFVVKNYVYT
jgi:hypothetical protein